jgi:hypothetical protein
MVRNITLDASDWREPLDFCMALKRALGCSEGHGSSVDAFVDSMLWVDMNSVKPPYMVRVHNLDRTSSGVRQMILDLAEVLHLSEAEYRERYGRSSGVAFVLAASDDAR